MGLPRGGGGGFIFFRGRRAAAEAALKNEILCGHTIQSHHAVDLWYS